MYDKNVPGGSRPYYYRLVDGWRPEPCDWFEAGPLMARFGDRCIGCDHLANGVNVSTAFLVFDHNAFGDGPPILWNTILSFPNGNQRLYRKYGYYEDAIEGHKEACAVVSLLDDALENRAF